MGFQSEKQVRKQPETTERKNSIGKTNSNAHIRVLSPYATSPHKVIERKHEPNQLRKKEREKVKNGKNIRREKGNRMS
jgi:hypothetical protein